MLIYNSEYEEWKLVKSQFSELVSAVGISREFALI